MDKAESSSTRCYALVPSAGIGARAGAEQPKQYVRVAGRAVVDHTLQALDRVRRLTATLVVLAPQDQRFERDVPGWGRDAACEAHVPSPSSGSGVQAGARAAGDIPAGARRRWAVRCGGATRAASVANGLATLIERGALPEDWVLVHDAARCLVQPADIERLIAACELDAVGGLLALPLADTLKREADSVRASTIAAGASRVAHTVDRRGLWQAQTPQMFRIGRLREALAAAGDQVTDEASAMEALGDAPLLVPGTLENFKLTWPADFALAERLLRTRA
ncbi:MAG: 2-C-methyl-D-erythritol 4-phosphate cytidylyltransferase [Methylibium sp.]|uniref:IspD/TarI family cytidylyltransferase n=1 Tax=Methylibium sp. TaxID=2067992 RepID=UPI0017ECD59A|nr:2-C-methyl-D-erythritol 4-phosphate cytidylyltransferase [Methylibium sp.]MBA3597008.1 2-C-methyl-D-erythritol 4-phosphate cytidylyltransferase [Methylibium sp.]